MLTKSKVKDFYDRFGSKQDAQFYEDRALKALISHASFDKAKSIFEFGIGTGKFAEKLLVDYLPADSHYFGIDISPTMVNLATNRLDRWSNRVNIQLSDGSMKLPVKDGMCDHFVSTYALDLLNGNDIASLLSEAHRILTNDGLLCIASLTYGRKFLARGVSRLWESVYRMRPQLLGGCRPIEVLDYLSGRGWKVEYHNSVTSFGITSEVVVAKRMA